MSRVSRGGGGGHANGGCTRCTGKNTGKSVSKSGVGTEYADREKGVKIAQKYANLNSKG